MPKAILNPLIQELRGALGEPVFRVSPNGEIIVSKRPDTCMSCQANHTHTPWHARQGKCVLAGGARECR